MHCLNTGLGDEPNRHTKDFSPPCTSSSSLWLLPRQRHQQDAIVVLVGNDRQIAARVDVYRELLRASHTQDGPHSPIEEIYHRSEEHTSELQSRLHLVCRLLLEKKKDKGFAADR